MTRPRLLMSAVGDEGGSGGAAVGGQPAGSGGGAPAGGGERTFAQSEVNRIAAQAREEGRRSALRSPDAAAGAAPSAGQEAPAWARELQEKVDRLTGNAPAGRARTFSERWNAESADAALAAGRKPTPTFSSGAYPVKVENFRDDGGLIDVFALPPEQVLAMGPARLREEFEKVMTRRQELSGAPPIPSFLRRKR
jgi:hypothetical protein